MGVEWEHTVASSRVLRALALAGFGAVGSVPLLVAAGAAWLVASAALAGDVETAAVLLGGVLLGVVLLGRRLVLQYVLFVRDAGGLRGDIPLRQLLGASAAWAVGVLALAWLGAPFVVLLALYGVAVFVCFPVVAALSSDGRVDTDAGELHVRSQTIPLAAVDRVSRFDAGPVALLYVHYHDGAASFSSPRLLGVARRDADRVRAALESCDAEPPEPTHHPLVRRVLAGFGVGTLALAALIGYAAATGRVAAEGRGALVYVAALVAVFGVLFLAVAVYES